MVNQIMRIIIIIILKLVPYVQEFKKQNRADLNPLDRIHVYVITTKYPTNPNLEFHFPTHSKSP